MNWARRHLNPIIDWTTDEVWEFIHEYNVPYCSLYDEGYTRLGCIGCPMGTVKHRLAEFKRRPKYKTAYIHAFDRMIQARLGNSTTETEQNMTQDLVPAKVEVIDKTFVAIPTNWETGEDVMEWWIK